MTFRVGARAANPPTENELKKPYHQQRRLTYQDDGSIQDAFFFGLANLPMSLVKDVKPTMK